MSLRAPSIELKVHSSIPNPGASMFSTIKFQGRINMKANQEKTTVKDLSCLAISLYLRASTGLKQVLELMEQNSRCEIPAVDAAGCLIGTLEAKHFLGHYLSANAKTAL
jgi:hypothetical protein